VNSTKYLIHCLVVLIFLIFTGEVQSAVQSGYRCDDCHTMHNSQDGEAVSYQLNASYSDFEPDTTPNNLLLISSCTGCHTSTGSSTIVSDTPIIFNTSSVSNPLAGGNFYDVRLDDSKGHNVSGISSQDGILGLTPPGGTTMTSQLTCAGEFGCHGIRNAGKNDYTGVKGAHHVKDSGGINGSSVGLSYRFLNGVLGKEDSDWEQDNTNTSHNEYKGSTSSTSDTVSYLCSGCHGNFHTWAGGASEVGTASPWLRHPTDIALNSTGEYSNYTSYSMTAPLARPDPDNVPDTALVSPGTDIVMCLSCHRAHASPYYKMLRWDYKNSNLSTALSGCNVCHTSKN
jgi:hypothetical protein